MEYAANPTPENLAKMQSEMMRLRQEMIAASMQDVSAAMNSAFGDDEAEQKKFVEEHPPAPGKAKYLPIGAFLLNTNGEPCETFALTGGKEEWREGISESRDIDDAQAGREMLESLPRGRHTRVFDEDYRKFRAGKPHKLNEDGVEAYNDMLETPACELFGGKKSLLDSHPVSDLQGSSKTGQAKSNDLGTEARKAVPPSKILFSMLLFSHIKEHL